ncbi:bifunctional diguanylate cyclase/phosphodiesterase [Novosphingobium sp. Gsoil 351]|uniref:putative bifunctional diguanylate cyclase/phosphodiesterase n=1 Tax=Novosphingobium sp. Gsoil 351 TaxID=2675225 RepID=UPI001E618EA6|nr:EAL domain-containing protein [Novosphingobium sp. Gsoil 351]
MVMAYLLPRLQSLKKSLLELLFEVGAFAYAGVCGLIAAQCMVLNAPSSVQTLTVANAMSYGAAMASRNAGRPAIAIGQLVLAAGPVIIAGAISPDLAHRVLAGITALFLPAMISISVSIFEVMRTSIAAAETSTRLAEKMQLLARTDVVTGLYNRAGLNHHLVERLMRLQGNRKFALFWLDLDRFKEVNDTLGHPVGDRVLSEIATRLRKQCPPDATIARFGGDEFIIACETDSRGELETLAASLLEAITQPIRIDGDRLQIHSSMGIAMMPDDGNDIDSLMQGADLALYHSKVNGRNQFSFFDPSMTRDLVRRREIESELRLAIQREELSIYFQPIVDLGTGRIRSFEALVRWFHPEKGELKPDEFIPVAEETGVIITLGNWITAQAAKTAAQWPEDVTLCVNLSPLQLRAPGAALGILGAIREAGLKPSRLELEITESVFLEADETTDNFIRQLAAEGVRFALDDFGTGYSSLGYLDKYPFSKIKIDRSFVSGLDVGRKSDAIIRAVAEMANTLEMEIVAEGLETVEQVRAVRAAGCTLGQGYYFSRAVPDYLAALLLVQEHEGARRLTA